MLAFLALLGAPYIYDISSLRVNLLGTPWATSACRGRPLLYFYFTVLYGYQSRSLTLRILDTFSFLSYVIGGSWILHNTVHLYHTERRHIPQHNRLHTLRRYDSEELREIFRSDR